MQSMFRVAVLFAAAAGLMTGCRQAGHPTHSAETFRTNSVEEATIQLGQRGKDGGFIIHVLEGPRGLRFPVRVYDDYGFMVHNIGDELHPQARFELALNRESRVVTCATMEEFQQALGALPKGSTLYHYDKCGASTAWGLDETKLFGEINSFCGNRGITVTNAAFATCTCALVAN